MSWEIKKTIGQVLRETAQAYPKRPAIWSREETFSYAELELMTRRMAKGLLGRGVRKGVHVGFWGEDGAVTLLCCYALWRIGAVVVPLCTENSAEELTDCIRKAEIRFLIVGAVHRGAGLAQIRPVLSPALPILPLTCREEVETLCSWGMEWGEGALQETEDAVCPEDPDTILFTSGTTGASKAVLTTHFSRVNTMFAQARAIEATEKDRFCSVLPLHHCFSLTATVLAGMCAGSCICFPPDRHGHTILTTIEQQRCTVLTAVPTLFSALLKSMTEHTYDLSSLRTGLIGGSSYAPAFFESICREMDFCLLPSLGQTEATAGITAGSLSDSLELRAHSIGRFLPHIEGCVKRPGSGETLPAGVEGELCLRGFNVMQGYYNQPRSTAAVIDGDGWLHTGDLGKMDAEGIVFYTGRLKELIIRGGENISPGEIEAILSEDRRVAAVKVVGVPDAHYTEELCACVVKNAALSAQEIREAVAARAARFKVPRYVLFLTALPRLPSGKINVEQLRRMAKKRLDEDPASMLSSQED